MVLKPVPGTLGIRWKYTLDGTPVHIYAEHQEESTFQHVLETKGNHRGKGEHAKLCAVCAKMLFHLAFVFINLLYHFNKLRRKFQEFQ